MSGTANRGGRPRFEFDLKVVAALASVQCTDEEIAATVGCAYSTLRKRKDEDQEFSALLEKAREGGKASLRRWQWRAASKGDRTMLVWLGKQHLGQSDRSTDVVVSFDPNTCTEDQLERIAAGEDPRRVLREAGRG